MVISSLAFIKKVLVCNNYSMTELIGILKISPHASWNISYLRRIQSIYSHISKLCWSLHCSQSPMDTVLKSCLVILSAGGVFWIIILL